MNAIAMKPDTNKSASPLRFLSALALGALFGLGLGVAGMTQPGKVVGFLDVFGDWDPALMGVMAGGILVNMLLLPFIKRSGRPFFEGRFGFPTRKDIDVKLVVGAVLFGIGWGLAGYCPGPGITALVTGDVAPIVFVGFMVVGIYLERGVSQRLFGS